MGWPQGTLLQRLGEIDLQRAAYDRLDALFGQRIGEFHGPKQIAGIGDGQGWHVLGLGQARQLLDMQRPLGQRIGRVRAQMDEVETMPG